MENKIEGYCRAAETRPIDELQFSIYRVPSHIRKNNESYYEPRMVSIGPYHREKEHLRAMQEHKWRYLGEYINNGRGRKEDYIQQIREMEPYIRACYLESFELDEEQFVETMLLDSCFIIQLFIKWCFQDDDPVHIIGWALPLLMADLTMVENQIPFFVLEKLYNIYVYGSITPTVNPDDRRPRLIRLLGESLNKMYNTNNGPDPRLPEAVADIKHLLHLSYLLFVSATEDNTSPVVPATEVNTSPVVPATEVSNRNYNENGLSQSNETTDEERSLFQSNETTEEKRSPRMIPSAKELQEFGVTFKKKKNFKSILDISFKDGVLEIPYIVVEEPSRSRYLNLIAFEQCISTEEKHLTSYAVFMDCLINTSEDVITLQRCGIIENKLADTTEAAKFFIQLRDCAYLDYERHYLRQVFVDITNYCQAFWPKHRARLCHDYFSSPWTICSLCAALLVLVITIFRTIVFIVKTF